MAEFQSARAQYRESKARCHRFVVDGVPYFMELIDLATMVQFSAMAQIDDPNRRVQAWRELVAAQAHRAQWWRFWARSGRRAVMSLVAADFKKLWDEWSGLVGEPGESSASPSHA